MAEQITFGQRIRDRIRIEAVTFVGNYNRQPIRRLGHRKVDLFARVVAVSVNHGVYHAFPNRHSQLVQIVFFKADLARSTQNRRFRHFHTVQGRIEQYFAFCHSFSVKAVFLGQRRGQVECSQ